MTGTQPAIEAGGNAKEWRLNVPLRECERDRRMPVRREGEGAPVVASAGEMAAAGRRQCEPLRTECASPVAPRLASLSLRSRSSEWSPEAGRGGSLRPSADLRRPDRGRLVLESKARPRNPWQGFARKGP